MRKSLLSIHFPHKLLVDKPHSMLELLVMWLMVNPPLLELYQESKLFGSEQKKWGTLLLDLDMQMLKYINVHHVKVQIATNPIQVKNKIIQNVITKVAIQYYNCLDMFLSQIALVTMFIYQECLQELLLWTLDFYW